MRRNQPPGDAPEGRQGWTSARAEEPTRAESSPARPRVDLRACGGTRASAARARSAPGGPPRVRRNPGPGLAIQSAIGWTSARAEEPACCAAMSGITWVDLRACGGTSSSSCTHWSSTGGPPRVRRNHNISLGTATLIGWTSARAEEPSPSPGPRARPGVDLRACGGTRLPGVIDPMAAGGPPRVRRNHQTHRARPGRGGWTSARAEEPRSEPEPRRREGVDLRACGGTIWRRDGQPDSEGGPPRVRRNLVSDHLDVSARRWTSARAEEPRCSRGRRRAPRVDLRACGGTLIGRAILHPIEGGPPRVRRNLRRRLGGCAAWVDLRACGGTACKLGKSEGLRGGPPRVRRNLGRGAEAHRRAGWTSARAEEPMAATSYLR